MIRLINALMMLFDLIRQTDGKIAAQNNGIDYKK